MSVPFADNRTGAFMGSVMESPENLRRLMSDVAFMRTVGIKVILVGERILFTRAPGIFVPKQNENFGAYSRKPLRFRVEETFSFDLMAAGLGMVALLIYILL